jgi:hypothetical protein
MVRCANPECNNWFVAKRCNHAFCSKRCNSAYRRVGWGWLRAMALELAGNQCEQEGCTCQTGLDCHHVLPCCYGGKNEISNLKILCRQHHKEVHKTWAKANQEERQLPLAA